MAPIKATLTLDWVHSPADTSLIPGTTIRRAVNEQWTLAVDGVLVARIVRHFPGDRRDYTLDSPLLPQAREWPYDRTREHRTLDAAQAQVAWLLEHQGSVN